MSDNQVNQLILDTLQGIRETQLKQAESLAGVRANFDNLVSSYTSTKKDVESLKEKSWKQTGFIGGFVILAEPVVHYILRKVGVQ
jgi:hypothetical protein